MKLRIQLPKTQTTLLSVLVGLAVVWGGGLQAQSALEFEELQSALRTAYAKIQRLESLGGGGSVVGESAAAANAEAAELKERYTELRGLLEALGIAALDASGDQVANRLLVALREMRLLEEQKDRLTASATDLLEASIEFSQVATPGNPESVVKLAAAIQKAKGVLQSNVGDSQTAGVLTDARIVSVKPEIGIAILNVGTNAGAKPGMPVNVFRGDQPIASVLITDVRKSVSGAVIQQLYSQADPIMVGDAGRVETSHSN